MEHERQGERQEAMRQSRIRDNRPGPQGARHEGRAVVAVVVTKSPDIPRLNVVLRRLAAQTNSVIVVDNGSAGVAELRRLVSALETVELVELGTNLGIAAALNIGVERASAQHAEWILTMDQDTVVSMGAIAELVSAFDNLPELLRRTAAILAMRRRPVESGNALARWASRRLVVARYERFVEKRLVMTSGNLVRADLAYDVGFNERLFMDQVDFDFCARLRARGFRVLEYDRECMEHRLGEPIRVSGHLHSYEGPQRLYYIVRNSTFLVLRRRLQVAFYLAQIVSWSGAYILGNGARSSVRCMAIVALGVFDGMLMRLGEREYRVLQR